MISRILGILFTLFFVFAAVVQLNDIDAWVWVALYGIAAIASVLFAYGRLKRPWTMVLVVVYLGLAIYHWPPEFEGVALQDGMKTMNVELGRESFGMGISALVLLIYFFMIPRKG